jgi:hypothetical protein
MDNDNGIIHNNQPFLGMHYESFHFRSHFFVITFLHWYMFHVPLFFNIDFCLELVWTIVHRQCNIVCNFEREKTMLVIQFFISKWCQYCCIFDHGQS